LCRDWLGIDVSWEIEIWKKERVGKRQRPVDSEAIENRRAGLADREAAGSVLRMNS